jgi:hypothetical protein
VRRSLFFIFLLAFFACTKTPDLLEQTELPDTAFTWQSVAITSKGIKQSSSLNPQNVSVSLPIIRLRLGSAKSNKFKATLSLSSSQTTATGTAEITYLDGITKQPLVAAENVFHRYEGEITSLGKSLKLPTITSTNRPCLEVKFTVLTGNGAVFKRLSSDPICPGVAPIDISVRLKTPPLPIYNTTGQEIVLRFERPFTPENPVGWQRLTVTVQNASNLTAASWFSWSNNCTTQQETLTCEGAFSHPFNGLLKTFDLPIIFDATNANPVTITAHYSSQAVETALANNTVTATLPVLDPPNTDLAVQWIVPSQIQVGQTVPVTITVTNLGSAANTARKLTANLGNTTIHTSPTNCGMQNSLFNCVVPPIPPNGTHHLTWQISTLYAQTLYLETTVFGNNTDWDVYGNNSATANPQVIQDPATVTDLVLSLTADPDPPQASIGQQYTVTITNASSNAAHNLELQFYSSAGVEFSTLDCQVLYAQCSLGTLAAGASRVLTFTSTTEPYYPSDSIQATVTSSSPESNFNDNNATIYATYPTPDVNIVISSNPNPATQAIGQTLTITMQNNGQVTAIGSLQTYYSGVALFSANDCTSSNQQNFSCPYTLEPNQSVTFTLTSTTLETEQSVSLYANTDTSFDQNTTDNYAYWSMVYEP